MTFFARLLIGVSFMSHVTTAVADQTLTLDGMAGGKRFDGIGVVNGGGATSVLLKDYPEPQRSQLLDLVYKPKFGASVSALLVEIPGDGNSTQGSMPSHMRTRDDLDYTRGYMWWVLKEAKARNPKLSLDGTAWSAPGWVGNGPGEAGRVPGSHGDATFWSQDAADFYVKWLQGLRSVYGLGLDAIGCRNEKGFSLEFAKLLRKSLNANGFDKVKLHAFDHWPENKFDFVKSMLDDKEARDAIDVLGAHTLNLKQPKGLPASAEVQAMAARMNKPIWNTEEHIYLKGFDCAISIVQAFNDNFIRSGVTKIVNWYDIAGVYPMEPYSEDPAALLAHWPWSGHYRVREALWGYAHYGQFTEVGWQYLSGGSGDLAGGGTFVTLKSPGDDYSIILETKEATSPQTLSVRVSNGLSAKALCVWRSNVKEQFVRLADISPKDGAFELALEPNSIYSVSTTTGQQKGAFADVPTARPFPMPYREDFESYADPKQHGHFPRYTADIAGVFAVVDRPDGHGKCLRQQIPVPTLSWAPDWRPFTILGDNDWQDYEVSADVCLNDGDRAAVMGRVNHVGTGYGFVPKGYYLELAADGRCRLVVSRGKKDPKKLVGDAEQQAAIKAGKSEGEGGERVLGETTVADLRPGEWHRLKLRFDGSTLTGEVDGKPVLTATDALYAHGMAGLLAGQDRTRISRPYFDNVTLRRATDPATPPASAVPATFVPIYGSQAK